MNEWIWILIESVDKDNDNDNDTLNSIVNVETQFLDNLKYGDKIKIKREDIAL